MRPQVLFGVFYRFTTFSRFVLLGIILTIFSLPAFGQVVYCPGQWYDQDKYNDEGNGRTKNYWSALGGNSEIGYIVRNEWTPSLAWRNAEGIEDWRAYDYQPCDTNRNYKVDTGETWDKFIWVPDQTDFNHIRGYYWCDLNRNGAVDAADPQFHINAPPAPGFNSFALDWNQNRIQDSWENWNVVQVSDDGSCWMATASNIMQYTDSVSRYHASAYVDGINYRDPIPGSDDLHYWTDGGRVQKMVEAWGFSKAFNSANYLENSHIWEGENPIPQIKGYIELGLPVGLGVDWAGGGGHAFTVYGIDTLAETLLIADSDSDSNNSAFYEIPYRWVSDGVTGRFEIDWENDRTWNGDYIASWTSLESTFTHVLGGDFGWFEGAFNGPMGNKRSVVIGGDPSYSTTVHLRPHQDGLYTYSNGVAGRLIIRENATLKAEPDTTLELSSMAINEGGKFILEGSAVNVYYETVCDGTMDITSGTGDFRRLTVGAQTPGQVEQSGGTMAVGLLQLGWDTLDQGSLIITQGYYDSTPEGTYRLTDGVLAADLEYIGANGIGTFIQTGGTNQINNYFTLGQTEGSTGTYTLTHGLLQSTSTTDHAEMTVGDYGDGTLNISGNSVLDCQGTFYAGRHGTSSDNSITLSGNATFLARGDEMLGYLGDAEFTQNTTSGTGHTVLGTLRMASGEFSLATYTLQSGRLTAPTEIIGAGGDARFIQVGGTHSVGNLFLAESIGSNATYLMMGGTLETTYNFFVGSGGIAQVMHDNAAVTVGNNFKLGVNANAMAQYTLTNDATLTVNGNETIGGAGGGIFTHLDGTNAVAGTLTLGNDVGGAGEYALKNGSITSYVTVVGQAGSGTFTQADGDHDITVALTLANDAGSTGIYTLDGGNLRTTQTLIGVGGEAAFTQNNGLHQISGPLYLAFKSTSKGVYTLNGADSVLQDAEAWVGKEGTGRFIQNDGTHEIAGNLYVGDGDDSHGSYTINDGILDVASGTIRLGRHTGSSGHLMIDGGAVIADRIERLGGYASVAVSSATATLRVNHMDLGSQDPTILTLDGLQVGHAGGTSDGFVQLGRRATVDVRELVLGYDRNKIATLQMVDQGGKTGIIHADDLYLGFMDGSQGHFFLDQQCNVTSDHQYVGYFGEGSIHQSQNTNTTSDLYLGFFTGSVGHYTLTGGEVVSHDEFIGAGGEGTFSHFGGTNTLSGTLFIGYGYGEAVDGVYNLSSGTLTAPTIDISAIGGAGRLRILAGSAQFNTDHLIVRSNGTVNSSRDLFWDGQMDVTGGNVLLDTDSSLVLHDGGRVDLSTGNVLADYLVVGTNGPSSQGIATSYFSQTGGNTQIAHDITIGSSTSCFGEYAISGNASTVSAERLFVGAATFGTMTHSAGTVTANQLVAVGLGECGIGTYNFSGGAIHTPLLEVGGEGAGIFNWTGGTLDADTVVLNTNGSMTVADDWIMPARIHVAGGSLSMTGHRLILDGPGSSIVSGGSISASQLVIGNAATTSLNHSGGTINTQCVTAGFGQGSGVYTISGPAILNTGSFHVGAGGSDDAPCGFVQSGGTVNVSSTTSLGEGMLGRYYLEGGEITSPIMYVGYANGGELTASGGTANVDSLFVGYGCWGYISIGGTASLNTVNTRIGVGGYGTAIQSGGVLNVADDLIVGEVPVGMEGTSSHYTLTDGAVTTDRTFVGRNGSATFRQEGGVHTLADSLNIGIGNAHSIGSYDLSGGTLTVPVINVGTTQTYGEFRYLGGTLNAQALNLVGRADSSSEPNRVILGTPWTQTCGQINIGANTTFQTDIHRLTINGGTMTLRGGTVLGSNLVLQSASAATGTIQGFGTFTNDNLYYNFTFQNTGCVIADGFGSEQTLDLSAVKVLTSINDPNADHVGWYAQNGGKLVYPSLTLTDGNWIPLVCGGDTGTLFPDRVNSLGLYFEGVELASSEATLSVSMLALDRSDIPAGLSGSILGVWDIDAPDCTFTNAWLALRYDDHLAASYGIDESNLCLYHYDGGTWVNVTNSIEMDNHLIWSGDLAHFSMFAVAEVPEPSGILLLLGSIWLGRKGKEIVFSRHVA